ncbi:TauD/TfdA family dioxygenase [Streptomyces sp. NPDC001508]|uniref:TauD/TfdA family dioxygenase n=1 Tax=Streptomyces sp. NPDC001508 TaxID=3154656 RepID=UPI0033301A83
MSTALPLHTPSGMTNRLTVLTLPARLSAHMAWLDQSFTAADYHDPARQDAARAELSGRVEGLATVLEQAASAVRDDQAVVLRGLPAQSTAMVVAVASAIGPVVPSRPDRPLIDDIKPDVNAGEQTRIGDLRVALTPHTDNSTMPAPPEILALAFVHNGTPDSGGESTLTHIDDIAAALDDTDVELLQEPRYPSLNVPTDAGRAPTLTSVLARRADGRLTVRYRDAALDAGIASTLAPETPSPAHLSALHRFTTTVREPARQTRARLDTGDMLIIDNARFLHGRTEIAANAVRHLKRLYTRLNPA